MSLNSNISLNIDPKQILPMVAKFRGWIGFIVVIGLVGYTGYQLSQITAIQPDQGYLTQQQATAKTPSLKVNKKTVEQLKQLQSSGDTSIPVTAGKQNPFDLAN